MRKFNLIKYHNDLKTLNINHLTLQENKIFIKIIQEVQNKQEEEVIIPFSSFSKILKKNITKSELIDLINSATNKAISSFITITNEADNKIIKFSFFNEFIIEKSEGRVKAQINHRFLYLINELIKNYSTLLLSEAVQFKSKYSLLMYKKIREFYNKGKLQMTWEHFKEYLGLPNADRVYINNKILSRLEVELPKVFKEFNMIKIKLGRKLSKIEFTWKCESNRYKLNKITNKP